MTILEIFGAFVLFFAIVFALGWTAGFIKVNVEVTKS